MEFNKEFVFDIFGAKECHASTVVKLSTGEFVCAWFGGTKEKANDVRIWVSVKKDGAWSTPIPVTPDDNVPHWNPVLYADENDKIILYYKSGYTIKEWKTFVCYSEDKGSTWSEVCELIEGDESGGRGPVKNKIIVTEDGVMIAPASTEIDKWRPFVDISTDGQSWQKCDIPAPDDIDMIQPSLWEYPKGCIHALMRTNVGAIYRSDSEDGGYNWCMAYPIEVSNNNSGIDLVKAENGNIYLVCNPVSDNWGARTPLTVFVSKDKGQSFEKLVDLETEQGRFAYPAIIAQDKKLYITYTWNRKKIAFVEMEPDDSHQ